jgi:hypothetical protein
MTIRILIADDHCIVAEGLRSLIQAQADMEVIACVQDGREAVRWTMETRPDVVHGGSPPRSEWPSGSALEHAFCAVRVEDPSGGVVATEGSSTSPAIPIAWRCPFPDWGPGPTRCAGAWCRETGTRPRATTLSLSNSHARIAISVMTAPLHHRRCRTIHCRPSRGSSTS